MSRFFLAVRILVLLALLLLLVAVFWGLANRDDARNGGTTSEIYEEYQGSRPAGYTSILLIGLVVVGVIIVLASIFFEYRQVRKGDERTIQRGQQDEGGKTEWR